MFQKPSAFAKKKRIAEQRRTFVRSTKTPVSMQKMKAKLQNKPL
jgi:hypothetical protein